MISTRKKFKIFWCTLLKKIKIICLSWAFKISKFWCWLEKFKNVPFENVIDPAKDIDLNVTNDWLKTINNDCKEDNIFNAEERLLKCTPDKTLKFKREKCNGERILEKCVTILDVW